MRRTSTCKRTTVYEVDDPDRFGRVTAASHRSTARVAMYAAGELLTASAPILNGEVRYDWGTGIRASLTLTVPPIPRWLDWFRLFPLTAVVYRGLDYGQTSVEVPMGVFPLLPPDRESPTAPLTITANDRWQWVLDDRLVSPSRQPARPKTKDFIAELLAEVDLTPVVTATSPARLAPQVWDQDRSDIIADLCTAIDAEAYVDRQGVARVRDFDPVSTGSVIRDGAGGTIVTIREAAQWDEVRNRVHAWSTNADSLGVRALASIIEPTHPLHESKIGRKVEVYESPQLWDQLQAYRAARNVLRKKAKLGRVYTISCVPDPRRDPGDRFTLQSPLGTESCVIQSVSTPLEAGVQTITTALDVTDG